MSKTRSTARDPATRRCECGSAVCTASISITLEEQDVVDHDPRDLWIVAPGHRLRGAQRATVVQELPTYTIIEAEESER
jgi:hypothetical protein